ncbi:MAG: [FeFe] hydrogenase H-cluster maturation GTPase HydF [Armatimonadota bacterium]
MNNTPKANRLHIGIFGRRNAGKSSLLNALTRQKVSIVSDIAGTTTDPVEKPMELQPLGPVLFIDTAGIDDEGALGELRAEMSRRVLDRADVALIVVADGVWGSFEQALADELLKRAVPQIAVFNKSDITTVSPDVQQMVTAQSIPVVIVSALTGEGLAALRSSLINAVPESFLDAPSIAGDLVPPGRAVVLVTPIDKEAPKGRLILPQVQTIRDLLDNDNWCVVVKERELRTALGQLREPPALVITDSQAFLKVAADTPPDVPMTSFSILFARLKGDLTQLVAGAAAIDRLKAGDKVLIAEACSHHPIADDIGRVKIPRWLQQYMGGELQFVHNQGHDFPEELSDYTLVIHCGGCMHNRRSMLTRIMRCQQAGVPMTNYGLAIAYCLGIFERALQPFPAALEAFHAVR